MRIKEGPIPISSGNPPADVDQITTYQVTLENTNCICNEDVRITRSIPENPADGLGTPFGSFEFLGFKESLDGGLSEKLEFLDIEDESQKTFFFAVKTGPNDAGCFFESAEFAFRLCDTGGGCDWLDIRPCEGPTPYVKTVRLEADALPNSSLGTATLTGTVRDSTGETVVGALVRVRRGCLGSPGAVNEQALTRPRLPSQDWCTPNCRGQYQITDLPAGTYTVSARSAEAGCAKAAVTITDGAIITQDFTLTQADCSDVEAP